MIDFSTKIQGGAGLWLQIKVMTFQWEKNICLPSERRLSTLELAIYRESEVDILALSEAQRKANDKYIKENYKQVKLSMPNEEAKVLDDYCKRKNVLKPDLFDRQ